MAEDLFEESFRWHPMKDLFVVIVLVTLGAIVGTLSVGGCYYGTKAAETAGDFLGADERLALLAPFPALSHELSWQELHQELAAMVALLENVEPLVSLASGFRFLEARTELLAHGEETEPIALLSYAWTTLDILKDYKSAPWYLPAGTLLRRVITKAEELL